MHLISKQEVSQPEQDTGCQEANGEHDVQTFVCDLIFSHPHREVGGEKMTLRGMLCQGGDRKSESLVLTLKVWWQVACPGI